MALVSHAHLGVRRRYRGVVRPGSCYPKIDRGGGVARAHLGVRLGSRNPKIDWVALVSRAHLGVRRRYRDDVRLDSRLR